MSAHGPWAQAFLVRHARGSGDGEVVDLRVEPSLVTARVDGRAVTLSAAPIPPGIWAAIDGAVVSDRQSEQLAQTLEHTWEEPLVPEELVRVGSDEDAAAVVRAFVEAIDEDPSLLLRFRGHGAAPTADEGAWRGGELPELPPPARRPPDSAPKRFGSSGITAQGEDLVETLIRVYAAFGD